MLIECGPRWPKPGRDWKIVDFNGEYRVVSTIDGGLFRDDMFCDAVARWLGFAVTYGGSGGFITNWDDVPHLWDLADVRPQNPVQDMSVSNDQERSTWPWD